MGCEMVCDQLNIDKKNQMTLGGFGKTNKRIKTLEEFICFSGCASMVPRV